MEIDQMYKFGGDQKNIKINLSEIKSYVELPENMRIRSEQVNYEASMASFICYCDYKKVDKEFISNRSGFSESEINQVIKETKELQLYDELCNQFLKQ